MDCGPDDPIPRRMFDEAIRLGDAQADRVVELTNDIRQLRHAIWRAIGNLRNGKPDAARRCLEDAVKK